MTKTSNDPGNEKAVCQKKSGSPGSRLVRALPACFAGQRGSRVNVGAKRSANDIYHSNITVSEIRGAWGLHGWRCH